MKIEIINKLETEQDVTVLGLFDEDEELYESFNKELNEELKDAIKNKHFPKKFGSIFSTKLNGAKHKRILIVCLGPKKEFTLEKLRRSMAKAVKYTKGRTYNNFGTNIGRLSKEVEKFTDKDIGKALTEGIILSNYQFKKYVSQPEDEPEKKIEKIYIEWNTDVGLFNQGCEEGKIIAESTNLTKELINEPAQYVTPSYLATIAQKIAKENEKIKLTILERKDMEELKMGALLGVSKGSDQPPKLIIIEYKGGDDEPFTAIVGKGITFDSGGLNLKPGKSMMDMKADMSGAAAVLGTMNAIAKLGVKKNIIAIAPCAENTINGSAMKPGDILTAYNGKTIEIGNTDAEGRLILADALSYVEDKYKPEIIIDIATLTGACVVALGNHISGLMGSDEGLLKDLEAAGVASYDRVWQLPILEEYQDSMKGHISDLVNIAPPSYGAGTITASIFLSKFVENAKWAHIDIAGPAHLNEGRDYLQKGATGTGVRLLVYYFLS
jgi:leucyl aminopeptidase